MVAVRVAANIADDEEDLVLMGKPLDKLDAELLILTHPDISQVARIKARADFLYEKLSTSDKITRVNRKDRSETANNDLVQRIGALCHATTSVSLGLRFRNLRSRICSSSS